LDEADLTPGKSRYASAMVRYASPAKGRTTVSISCCRLASDSGAASPLAESIASQRAMTISLAPLQ